MMRSSVDVDEFTGVVLDYYRQHGRDLPWRRAGADGSFDPYKILVSEIMLQQTQVKRVIPKYQQFLERFPTVEVLAAASLGDVLKVWSGLGYNRRAKYLYEAAQALVSKTTPWKLEDLTACKGIGHNTAAAVMVYAYNQPIVFIETNIRTVFIHHFFQQSNSISDQKLIPLVSTTLITDNPREWCWALMDYGTYLKATVGNATRSSKYYVKQSTFQGSRRQIRGQVIRLLAGQSLSGQQLRDRVADERLDLVLAELAAEGLIIHRIKMYTLA